MPEPVTVIIGGVALYAWLKGKAAPTPQQLAATPAGSTADISPIAVVPPGSMATNTSDANGLPLALADQAIAVPADLVSALDNDSALMFRAYVALNPQDFQVFLDRYADHIELRNDLYFHALNDPPSGGYQVTPGMLAAMGSAAYKVVQALNGVAVGKYGDLFGAAASTAGAIPGVSPQLVQSLQGLTLGYRAFTSGVQAYNVISELALANGVGFMDVTASLFGVGETALTTGIAAPIASLSGLLMAVGLVVDIGMTIIGDAPDVQKAIDVALDVASLACLFIPVVGWVIAIVIQLVKFIIDIFGSDLFGGGLSHEQREALETARYGANLNPMFPAIANAFTPRELHRVISEWTSGYCGGQHVIAMAVNLVLKEGDVVMVGGQPLTITGQMGTGAPVLLPPGVTQITLGIGDNGPNGGQCYWFKGTPFERMTNDEIALALAKYASTNGVIAEAQAGIREDLKTQFNVPVQNTITARAAPMKNFVDHNVTLDQFDQIALEYRAQPHLGALAAAYGWPTWQELFASIVADEWRVFNWTVSHGSLSDFARQNGYRTMYAFRAAALGPWEAPYSRLQAAIAAAQNAPSLGWFATWYTNLVNQGYYAAQTTTSVSGGGTIDQVAAAAATGDAAAQTLYEQMLWQQASSNAP